MTDVQNDVRPEGEEAPVMEVPAQENMEEAAAPAEEAAPMETPAAE